MDQLFLDLNKVSNKHSETSIHLAHFPKVNDSFIDAKLETQMEIAQRTSSLVLGLRKKEKLRVRQPLQKIMVPVLNSDFAENILHVKDLILSEVNVKELELLAEDNSVLVKSIKPNFKTIGPKYGKHMKAIAGMVAQISTEGIAKIEQEKGWKGEISGEQINLDFADFDINAKDIPGWLVSSEGDLTVALDVTISDQLKSEGVARELINRVQNLRKDSGLEVTDRILLKVDTNDFIKKAIQDNVVYVCNEVLANEVVFEALNEDALQTDLAEKEDTRISLVKG